MKKRIKKRKDVQDAIEICEADDSCHQYVKKKKVAHDFNPRDVNCSRTNGERREGWSSFFQLLQMFKQKYGHTNLLYRHDRRLAHWIHEQKSLLEYIKEFQGGGEDICSILQRLTRFVEHLEDSDEKACNPETPQGSRVSSNFKPANLNHKKYIHSLGSSVVHLKELLNFKKMNGHCNHTGEWSPELVKWVHDVRRMYAEYEMGVDVLSEELIYVLSNIGFDWEIGKTNSKNVTELKGKVSLINDVLNPHKQQVQTPEKFNVSKINLEKDLSRNNGHFNQCFKLHSTDNKRTHLHCEQEDCLIIFDMKDEEEQNSLINEEAKPLAQMNKDKVEESHNTDSDNASRSVSTGMLDDLSRTGMNNALEDNDHKWNEFFLLMQAFTKKHGHCNVEYRHDFHLAHWIFQQKVLARKLSIMQKYKKSINSFTHKQTLKIISFLKLLKSVPKQKSLIKQPSMIFTLDGSKVFLKQLIAFKKEHKHCNVPNSYPTSSSISLWMKNVRKAFSRYLMGENSISEKMIFVLTHLGFQWGEFPKNRPCKKVSLH